MTTVTGLNAALEYHVVNTLRWPALRPLQEASVAPVRSGADCLLVAPTAGGKTEAATFPVLSRMVDEEWRGLSVIYVTPLKALLNNLHPRLEQYAAWLGRTVGLWHGDIGDSARQSMLNEPPDVLLTTPESLESMLVSRRVDHRALFSGVRAIIVDEVHAFAGGDRGWHLLAVLERLQRISGQPIQRIGLSATVGNPNELIVWLQGSNASAGRPAEVVRDTSASTLPPPEVTLDYVGSVENAALVLSRLHRGEKRLAFCVSRAQAEELAYELRKREVMTFVSHSSLSVDERRRSEQAFAEARDCVIVATSTLELGIDIGDLDRVIQIDAPFSVASFLQRLGRTGRRPGSTRNALFLATSNEAFLRAAGLLRLWVDGFVEPVIPPPSPRHLVAQQLLALALQEGRFSRASWRDWWAGLPMFDDAELVLDHLIAREFLASDGGMLFIGPAAEKEFGRRYFMELLSSFVTDLELTVMHGRNEIGTLSPMSLPERAADGSRPLLLAGRAWKVLDIDWKRHVVMVEPDENKGASRWHSALVPEAFEMVRARRDVLLGADPGVTLSRRGAERLALVREERAPTVSDRGLVVIETEHEKQLWAWGGLRAHQTLIAAVGESGRAGATNEAIQWPVDYDLSALASCDVTDAVPLISPEAVDGLKFSAALPRDLAVETLGERFADRGGAAEIADARRVLVVNTDGDEPSLGS